jgi:cell division protein FtsW
MDCDKRILLIVVFLAAIGASLVASSSSFFSAARFDDPYFLLKRHIVRIFIAALFLTLAMRIDYRVFRKLSPYAFAAGVILLIGLFIFGHAIRNSVRWYHLEFLQVTLQPAEIARFALVLFLAYWITHVGKDIVDFRKGFLPAALATGIVLALMAAQPNYGTASATALVALITLYLGGARLNHLYGFAASMAGVAALKIMQSGYLRDRVMAYVNHGEALRESNWQIYQSLIGLGSGGILGAGFGESRQKLQWLPDSHTDFIFSILGEEAGLVGTVVVSLLFLLFVLRSLKISRQSGDKFGEMLAVGIGGSIFVYAVLNMSVATGLFPVTGLPLPFLSYGGSALVVNAFSIGVLLNVSKRRSPSRSFRRRSAASGRGQWSSQRCVS